MAASGADVVLLQLASIFVLAKLAGFLASGLRITPLVGEILAGVLVANSPLAVLLQIPTDLGASTLGVFAELGVVFLIFTVGLETNLQSLTRVGRTSITTAGLGVLVPFAAGWGLLRLLGHGGPESLFFGVALVATSVGITARVLGEMDALGSITARIILGAAVLDDVLGLLLLTIVSSAAIAGTVALGQVGVIVATALAFFAVSFLLGRGLIRFTRPSVEEPGRRTWARFMSERDFPVVLALGLCLALSALAVEFGLAAIIGAFVAGLLFEPAKAEHDLVHRLESITHLLAPFFFVFIGLAVDVSALGSAFWLILGVTAVALVTKIVPCALGSLGQGREVALAVGIGMAPRGEVGIIVALLGLDLGIVGQELYTVVVAMSVLTTLVAPPMLSWALGRVPLEKIEEPVEPDPI